MLEPTSSVKYAPPAGFAQSRRKGPCIVKTQHSFCQICVFHSNRLRSWHKCTLYFRYFLICVNYFFYGETVADYFGALVQREEPLQFLVRYHRFISFAVYLAGECNWKLA